MADILKVRATHHLNHVMSDRDTVITGSSKTTVLTSDNEEEATIEVPAESAMGLPKVTYM